MNQNHLQNSVVESEFSSWAWKNRQWIDLFFNHGITQAAMDDIQAPYKCWKTVMDRINMESRIDGAIKSFPICPGHMCFYNKSITQCSVCARPRSAPEIQLGPTLSWISLRQRLERMFVDKARCDSLYKYLKGQDSEGDPECIRDSFDTDAFARIADASGEGMRSK
ncbi:hypothetical protein BWQ96_07247 [Gracilariopsis chorda]|uniref:Uncharacterized protein n=1 Tax=Gracilariopsis chorda TaxID=448386 RepID=A0A2V3ILR2_9FLOR|nr:hypothetical protein BWQ96_07247 [Gracilariopsis chorda]|eukprot:PXF42999.1 hypothetical protein BWQ96_07247 [Gracilariopsis chorda]